MIIGLTGGIASGKSTIAGLLVQRGALLVDADQVAREVVQPGEPALAAIVFSFGQAVLAEDGSLDRKALGSIVFADKDKLAELEAITHPAIRTRMQQRIHEYAAQWPERLVVADIPLLYETKQQHLYEGIMVAYVPAALQLERLMKRNGLDAAEGERRILLQMDIEEKRRQADWVIDNSGTLKDTERQIAEFWESQGLL
jgi:dephospho-CoA kinase